MSEEAAKKEPRVIKMVAVLRVAVEYREGETNQSLIRKQLMNNVMSQGLAPGMVSLKPKGEVVRACTTKCTDGWRG